MITVHSDALRAFAQRLHWLLAFRLSLRLGTAWLFLWGVLVLACRLQGLPHRVPLWWGTLGLVPCLFLAFWLTRWSPASHSQLRARYDSLNRCGGLLMAQESHDMGAWLAQLGPARPPRLRWRAGQTLLLFALACLFVAAAFLVPDPRTGLPGRHPLELGSLVQQLQEEVKTLAQEKILENAATQDLERQLAQLEAQSSSVDPNKTWEALDHIKQANSDAAHQALENALNQLPALAKADALAQAMEQAADRGMSPSTTQQAAEELSALLKTARLDAELAQGQLSPELLSDLKGLSKQQLEALQKALQGQTASLQQAMGKLAEMKMIDPSQLARCLAAAAAPNPQALADFLASCPEGTTAEDLDQFVGNGGPGGGGPAAAMTWKEESSEQDTDFKAHSLPAAKVLSEARLTGISKAAPALKPETHPASPDGLQEARADGGSAHAQTVLPEHRQAVQNYFKREN